MAQSEERSELVPGWKVTLAGAPLDEEIVPDVLGLEVEQYVDGADAFDISVSAWDLATQETKWLDDDTFAEGTEVEIRTGYGEEMISLIKGEIVALQIEYGGEMTPVLHVQGYDKLHRFRRGRKTRTFANVRDSEIAEAVAQEMQLQAEVEDTGIVHAHLFQYNQSDIDFLQDRARRIQYEIDVVENTLHFRQAANDRGETVELKYRETLKSFNVRLSTLSQVNRVVVKGWNVAAKEPIVGLGQIGDERTTMDGRQLGVSRASDAFGEFDEVIVDKPVFGQSEADQIAKGVFNRMNLEYVKAEGECIGNALLRAGDTVRVGGLGEKLSGLYYLTQTHHIIDEGGYRTRLECRRNATS